MEAGFNYTTCTDNYDDRNLTGFQDDRDVRERQHDLDMFFKNMFITYMFPSNYVVECIIISISLPVMLVTIYALFSLVRQGQVAPIYVINLLISDIIQLCCLIVLVINPWTPVTMYVYFCGLVSSVGFMVCISLERYLVIVHPLWYRFKRTIKISVAVCAVVWAFPPVYFLIVFPWVTFRVGVIVLSIIFIIPFPLFIFFLVRTLRALSSSISIRSDEKRRVVGTLVVVVLLIA